MADLLVIAYPTEEQAEAARTRVFGMQRECLIELADAVVALKQPDETKQDALRASLSGAAPATPPGG